MTFEDIIYAISFLVFITFVCLTYAAVPLSILLISLKYIGVL